MNPSQQLRAREQLKSTSSRFSRFNTPSLAHSGVCLPTRRHLSAKSWRMRSLCLMLCVGRVTSPSWPASHRGSRLPVTHTGMAPCAFPYVCRDHHVGTSARGGKRDTVGQRHPPNLPRADMQLGLCLITLTRAWACAMRGRDRSERALRCPQTLEAWVRSAARVCKVCGLPSPTPDPPCAA